MQKKFTAIVMVDKHWGIGNDGDRLIYLPYDLKRVKQLTAHRTVIYGRKTMQTLPGGHPLQGRRNIILSSMLKDVPDAEVCHSIDELLEVAPDNAFVVGGESVYRALLPCTDTVIVTKVDVALPADCHFPNLNRSRNWKVHEKSKMLICNDVPFQYITYRRLNT